MPNEIELLDLLLKNRGIKEEDKEKFLNPSYEEGIYDPYLMKDMEKTVVRIFEAVEAKEKIVIYSDYDCDGIPASVIMHDFFTKIGYTNFTIYIPDRHDEGYGLHMDAIKNFINEEVDLLITFDLGITAVDEVVEATAGGIDVIITDHHLPHAQVPRAYAILNPKQDGCTYPDTMLCGAGIAFKLIQALIIKYGEYWKINKGWEKWLLDMAGIATLADQVPLLDENRVLATYGLKVLQKGRRLGLVEIFKKAGVDITKLSEEDVTFTLAPRINAASRMADPMMAFEMLSATDAVIAKASADNLAKINDERKIIVAHMMKEVKKVLGKREDKKVIVIGNPTWRVGVLGIIASKIAEEYKRPAFVWGTDGSDDLKGSCRSWGGANLVEIMTALPENSLLGFGGHAGAGGFSVAQTEIHFLEERILNVYGEEEEIEVALSATRRGGGINESIEGAEAIISIDDITSGNYNVIEKLAPYGEGNPKPKFLFKELPIYGIKEFGKEKNHLELSYLNSKGKIVKAIAFFKTRESYNNILNVGERIDLVATFEKSTFGGRTELRLRIVDIIC
ncbi:MAG: Single-stranded-DNA-specific exonuclease [Candidatus Nomurabacteria bacterium GW2011_GWF2_35_66]|nr:MAG: Single-stranded-DNA-specific exonuclease [Candidatus Nomurabacteria bacterium GW2011_GWF1_34_20]KKP62108.1 MAG: Single-stranded-DNA-specific exonuclease [Candidatus Nomurabacteria bacterium GW2011_GWE2_34_25]KKP83020.1 MAG: Single-stranded-DNA-specific exonuclease [Candidatus Nomurabacteria bacterium GW2011_GWF2_35_66]HAE36983.1 single-stranded-DNA-specific exonuclease RecJ [Candidatus Nomurabacteria bacterium]HAX65107.1 single-stranded-DNA-specific exonuclease RecJ [Candidatus Nomuraba